MFLKRKVLLAVFAFVVSTALHAQLEVARLTSKGFSANGFGAFLHTAIPVSESAAITAEAGFYYFKGGDHNIAMVPFLLGYRHLLNGTEAGFYVEPAAGYTIGGSDIQKKDANGRLLYNSDGSEVDQKVKGITAGLGTGYILTGGFPLNIGLRYQHVFVAEDPTLNLFSFRLSYPLSTGRRRD